MSDLMQDVGSLYGEHKVGNQTVTVTKKGSNMDLDMTDFITLMITQMTNQGIDDTMDTSEMLNQMVQMQMITSMVNMTDATTMNYAASLVGKEVTVGKYVDGELQELVGTVTATATKDGQQVIFMDDEYYYLNEIMAVGRLPEPKEDEETEGTEDGDKTEGTENPGETPKPGEPESGETVTPGGGTAAPVYNGESGAPQDGEG